MTWHALPTPCAVVDHDALQNNLREMASVASLNGKALRPHAKTHKCVEIARMQRELGARGITVAKLGEAEVFAEAGFDDILIANLIVGADKLARLANLAGRADITVGLDSNEVLDGLARCARQARRPIGVYIEVDTGHHRTGVRSISDAECLARRCRALPGLDIRGVYTHEGHVYKAAPDRIEEACRLAADTMAEYAAACGVQAVSVGSTPGARYMASMPTVTELRPGNYVFHDGTQVRLGASPAACALTVTATVIATPSEGEAFVDAGSKALSGDRDSHGNYGFMLGESSIVVDWCSEEHGHLDLSQCPGCLRIGDRVRIVPAHACTCVNCHDRLHILEGESQVDTWPVAARGRLT